MHMKRRGSTKLLAKKHTAKLRHHRHTSYGSLLVILVLAFIPVFSASRAVSADDPTAPVSDSEGVYGVVVGPVPATAPTIANIASGRTFTTSDPVPVQGSCPPGTLVKLFKNEVFAGGTLCQNGTYRLSIDLFVGSNALVARAYNTNDAASPDSSPVTVTLSVPNGSLAGTDQLNKSGFAAGQFYLSSSLSHRGVEAGDALKWPLTVTGGTAPFAVTVDWGDGKTDLISRQTSGPFDITHTYKKSGGYRGSYTVIVRAADATGNKSYLQLVSIVSGGNDTAGLASGVTGGYKTSPIIRIAWQLLAASVLVVLAFWLGERREAHVLKRAAGSSA
jgi:hypothetical protein